MFPFPVSPAISPSPYFLRDDMNVHWGSISQESVDSGQIQIPAPPGLRGSSEHYLRYVLLTHDLGNFFRHFLALGSDDLCTQVPRELHILFE
jgi:hypothetical protein